MLECVKQTPNILQYQTSYLFDEVGSRKYCKYFAQTINIRN